MGDLGGRLVGGVLADHRENGIGVRVVQSRYGLEGGSPSGRYSRRMSESTNIIGRWRITEMDNWDREAVDLVQPGFIEFDDDGLGSLGFIVVTGELDCREADRDGRPGAEFSWQGSDEGDDVSGRGWAALNPDGTLEGHIYFHLGDDSAFRAERLLADDVEDVLLQAVGVGVVFD